jgi:hypothetical protein
MIGVANCRAFGPQMPPCITFKSRTFIAVNYRVVDYR